MAIHNYSHVLLLDAGTLGSLLRHVRDYSRSTTMTYTYQIKWLQNVLQEY